MEVKEDSTATTADLVAVDKAAEAAKANGGGDIAVLNARKSELAVIRNRTETLAGIDKDAALAKAKLWPGKRGDQMRENAWSTYHAAVKAARLAYSTALDSFSINNGFIGMVAEDQRLAILGRRAEKLRIEFAELFEIAARAGLDSIPTETGRSWNVAEMVEFYSAPMPTPETATTESGDEPESNVTESAAA